MASLTCREDDKAAGNGIDRSFLARQTDDNQDFNRKMVVDLRGVSLDAFDDGV
jgi:hypothetical protein